MAIILCRGTVVQSSKAFVCQCHNGPIMFFFRVTRFWMFSAWKKSFAI